MNALCKDITFNYFFLSVISFGNEIRCYFLSFYRTFKQFELRVKSSFICMQSLNAIPFYNFDIL